MQPKLKQQAKTIRKNYIAKLFALCYNVERITGGPLFVTASMNAYEVKGEKYVGHYPGTRKRAVKNRFA